MSGFILPELVIESIIRDGIANLVNNPSIIDNVFSQLTQPYLGSKYGSAEIQRIKDLINKKQIKVVHNLSDIATSIPCYSIQLGQDVERKPEAVLEDYIGTEEDQKTGQDLLDTIKASGLVPLDYNSKSGILTLAPGADLSQVQKNHVYIDASGVNHSIELVDRNNDQLILNKGLDVDISDFGEVRSTVDFIKREVKNVASDEQIIVGVHGKDALTTKYLYILLKYFVVSRKKSMINRCFIVSSFNGSDFSRNLQIMGDHVYNRFLTITGRIDDSWKADEVEIIENVEVQTLVPKAKAKAEDLGIENQSVRPSDRDESHC
jgi:hypothetical protein